MLKTLMLTQAKSPSWNEILSGFLSSRSTSIERVGINGDMSGPQGVPERLLMPSIFVNLRVLGLLVIACSHPFVSPASELIRVEQATSQVLQLYHSPPAAPVTHLALRVGRMLFMRASIPCFRHLTVIFSGSVLVSGFVDHVTYTACYILRVTR
jgi:hypothetical protein